MCTVNELIHVGELHAYLGKVFQKGSILNKGLI